MENDLDIFRKREERKKKKKPKPEPQAVFLSRGAKGEGMVNEIYSDKIECISTPNLKNPLPEPRYDEVYFKGLEEFK